VLSIFGVPAMALIAASGVLSLVVAALTGARIAPQCAGSSRGLATCATVSAAFALVLAIVGLILGTLALAVVWAATLISNGIVFERGAGYNLAITNFVFTVAMLVLASIECCGMRRAALLASQPGGATVVIVQQPGAFAQQQPGGYAQPNAQPYAQPYAQQGGYATPAPPALAAPGGLPPNWTKAGPDESGSALR